jgi:hypothetical protein
MPISYKVDATKRRVFTRVSGSITALDIVGHFEVARREGFLPYAELIDASSIMEPTLTLAEIAKAASAVRNLPAGRNFGSRAVWVANDTIFVLTRMFTTLLSGYISMDVFLDQISAEKWLNQQAALAAQKSS